MRTTALLLTLLSLVWSVLPPTAARADEPVVRAVLFWSENCPHCHTVIDETLPPLQDKYGSQLYVQIVEISDPAHYELWRAAIESFQVPTERAGIPMLFIGDLVLVGSYEISGTLPGLIEQYLTAGGVDYPAIPGLLSPATSTPQSNAPSPQPVVHVVFFYDRLCQECVVVQEEVLAPLQERYGAQLVLHQRDLEGSATNYNLLRALERRYGLAAGDMPAVFVGQDALNGQEAVRERLPGLIEEYLAQGGASFPSSILEETTSLTPTPTARATDAPVSSLHLAYFYQPGCRECDRVQLDLNYLQQQYPQLVVHAFDVKTEAALAEWLGQRAGIAEEKRLTAPAVFVGDEGLVGEELHTRSLEALVARYADTGAEAVWEGVPAARGGATGSIVARFRSFGLLTVLAAGLVDGLNPCAFATIVFFLSYLAFVGRPGREMLATGVAFTLGVFLTYLGVGVGLLRFLAALPFLDAISRWLYGLTAVLCLFLAAGSLYDWWQARHGNPDEMRLKLPTGLRRRINQVIRERAGLPAFIPVTFFTGAVVSVMELACTGQVYLPTIVFVLGVPDLRVRAGLYLVLYNLMFILPLVAVFLLAYFGTSSRQLGVFIHRRAATIKLATAGLFVLLAGWLVVAVI